MLVSREQVLAMYDSEYITATKIFYNQVIGLTGESEIFFINHG